MFFVLNFNINECALLHHFNALSMPLSFCFFTFNAKITPGNIYTLANIYIHTHVHMYILQIITDKSNGDFYTIN